MAYSLISGSYSEVVRDSSKFARTTALSLDLDRIRTVADDGDRGTLDIVANVVSLLCTRIELSGPCSANELIRSIQIIPQYEKLLRRWLDDLNEAGLLERNVQGFDVSSLARRPPPSEDNLYFDGVTTILLDVLRGRHHILEYVFGDLRPPWFSAYTAAYDGRLIFEYQHAIVARLVERLVARATRNRPMRLIEIGAGMGGLTARLLDVLPPKTCYLYTDVKRGFIDQARTRFASSAVDVHYAVYDMNCSPERNGVIPGGFDAVVAFNVLHCAKHLGHTLAWLGSLLRPRGLFVNEQLTRNRPGHLIIPGVMPGFTDFEDDRLLRCRTFLTPTEWLAKLAHAGFVDTHILPEDASLLHELGHGVIIARAP